MRPALRGINQHVNTQAGVSDMADIHIYDVPDNEAITALIRGQQFAAQFPDRVGIHQSVIYGGGTLMIAYRTKTGRIVVRGERPHPIGGPDR